MEGKEQIKIRIRIKEKSCTRLDSQTSDLNHDFWSSFKDDETNSYRTSDSK